VFALYHELGGLGHWSYHLDRSSLTCSGVFRTLFVSSSGLKNAKMLVCSYKQGKVNIMTPEIWQAKKIVDSTLHPGRTRRRILLIYGSADHE
jgi:hypothetical protein